MGSYPPRRTQVRPDSYRESPLLKNIKRTLDRFYRLFKNLTDSIIHWQLNGKFRKNSFFRFYFQIPIMKFYDVIA